MSWSPDPYDFEDEDYSAILRRGQRKEKRKTYNDQVPVISQLPSSSNAYGVLTRNKLASRHKSARSRVATDEVISMKPILSSEDVVFGNKIAPAVSGGPKRSIVILAGGQEEILRDLSYNDMDVLKEMRLPMVKKKELRYKLTASLGKTTRTSRTLHTHVKWHHFKEDALEVIRLAALWRHSIHEIEGQFGNGIRSYFSFLRWLFLLNLYIFFTVFAFIVVPTIALEVYSIPSLSASTNVSADCQYDPYNPNSISSFPQYIIWWFTGQGFMENTLLFYGYYDNVVTTLNGFSYNLPVAYLVVTWFYFLFSLIFLVRRAAAGLKERLTVDKDRFYTYCNKLFAGWDFCITNENTAKLKHKSLKFELQSDLEEERIRQKQANRTRKERAILYSKRFFINFLVVVVLVGCMAAIFLSARYALANGQTFKNVFLLDLLVTYLTSLVITVANFIAPLIFEVLIKFEDYSPAFTIKFTLIRTVFLRLASIVFLYAVVYLQIHCEQYSVGTSIKTNCSYCEGVPCWETYLGQEMYKLTILDFFIVIGVTIFVEFPRKIIVQHCSCNLAEKIGEQEFSIPNNVLDIVYAQTIAWIGAFYAPLLPVMVVIKFFIFFYVKKLTLVYNCRPAARPYRASKSGTFFFIILLFGFVVAALPVVVSVAVITPSLDCGPFRGWPTMFYAMTLAISQLPDWFRQVLWFIGSVGFMAIIIVLLCLTLYYFYALSSAHRRMITVLKEQLILEGKDKQYLLNRVNKMRVEKSDEQIEMISRHNSLKPPDIKSEIEGGYPNPSFSRSRGYSYGSVPGQIKDYSSD